MLKLFSPCRICIILIAKCSKITARPFRTSSINSSIGDAPGSGGFFQAFDESQALSANSNLAEDFIFCIQTCLLLKSWGLQL